MPWPIGNILKLVIAECPECMCKIPFYKTVFLGQLVDCPECLERLRVSSLNPPELEAVDQDRHAEYEEWLCDP